MTRDECYNQALKYVKNVAYTNPNQFTKWYFKDDKTHAWCGAFIDYVIKNDLKCDWLDDCKNFAYVPEIVRWAKSKGYWNQDYTKAKKGDLVVFNWTQEKDHYSHIGIVEVITSKGLDTVEGNTNLPPKYSKDCVAKKSRVKKNIVGVVLLPYKEEEMIKVGDYVYALEDIKLYTTVECKESKYTIKKGQKAYVRHTYNNNKFVALADPITHEYFESAWTSELDKLAKEEINYKKLYEEEVAENEKLNLKITELERKINKAILDLQ